MFGGEEWLVIAIVALVLFGGAQLPKLARSLGEAQRELKKAMADNDDDGDVEPAGKNGASTDQASTDQASTDQASTDQAIAPKDSPTPT